VTAWSVGSADTAGTWLKIKRNAAKPDFTFRPLATDSFQYCTIKHRLTASRG